MKKSLIPMLLAAIASLPSMAQDNILNNPDNEAYFGIRVGGEITCPGNVRVDNIGLSMFNNGGGIEFGGIYNIPVVANCYIEPGLSFYQNSYSLKDEFVKGMEDDIIFNSVSIKKFGMRVPVMIGYHFDFTDDIRTYIFTGPELEIGFSAKEKIEGHNIEMTESLYGDEGDMKRVNILWGMGAGMSYRNFILTLKGSLGILNSLDEPDVKFHENRVTISLGYNF